MVYEIMYSFEEVSNNCYVVVELLERRFGFLPFWFFPKRKHVGSLFVERPKTTWDEPVSDEEYAITISRKTKQVVTKIDTILKAIERSS
jgi:hypothetical protein